MKLKKLLAILVVCAVAMSAMVLPASARLTNSNHNGGDGQHFMITAYHSNENRVNELTKEDVLKIYGFEFIINVTSAPEVGFGGRIVINDNIGRWRNADTWSSPDGENPIKAVNIEGSQWRVRLWSRTTQLFSEANWGDGETYIELVLGLDWGEASVIGWEYLDQGGNVIPKVGGSAPAPTPDPEPTPPAPPEIVAFDGTYKSSDALNILRIVAGLIEADEDMLKAYDLNGDGEITSADAILVLQIIAGVIDAPDGHDHDDCDDDECEDDH